MHLMPRSSAIFILVIELLAAATFIGCMPPRVFSTTLKAAAPHPDNCYFDIYTSECEVPRRFESLCIVEAFTGQTASDDTTMSGAIKLAQPKLCNCGADAAILLEGTSAQVGLWEANDYTLPQDRRGNAILKGIRFVD